MILPPSPRHHAYAFHTPLSVAAQARALLPLIFTRLTVRRCHTRLFALPAAVEYRQFLTERRPHAIFTIAGLYSRLARIRSETPPRFAFHVAVTPRPDARDDAAWLPVRLKDISPLYTMPPSRKSAHTLLATLFI